MKNAEKKSDEPLISEVCYLMQRCEVSLVPPEPSVRPLCTKRVVA